MRCVEDKQEIFISCFMIGSQGWQLIDEIMIEGKYLFIGLNE